PVDVLHRSATIGPAGGTPRRLAEELASQVPERRVDRGEGQARDRPHHGSMSGPEELLPDALDLAGVLTGQQAEQVVAKVGEHGPPTCSDRVGVSDTHHSLAVLDLDEDRLLLDEGLDRI